MASRGKPKGSPKTGGRVAGTKNKTTRTALEAIQIAAEGLGGAARLQAWSQEAPENERVFWGTIYPKLLPLQVTGSNGSALVVQLAGADGRI